MISQDKQAKIPWASQPTIFHLTIFDYEGHPVVVASELVGNPGPSVTNAWPELAKEIYDTTPELRKMAPDPRKIWWIEHYGPFSYRDGEREQEFSLVHISPTWWDLALVGKLHWMPGHPDGKRVWWEFLPEGVFGNVLKETVVVPDALRA